MYKLIIIDDEKIILEHLSKAINWDCFSFELIETFTDPKAALEYLKCNTVDAVITDIKMPDITGIDIAKEIHENYPTTFCILLSAYQEFGFAQLAIKYGVFGYMLKPISYSEFESTCNSLKQKLDTIYKNKNMIRELSYIKLQNSINNYLTGKITDINDLSEILIQNGITVNLNNAPVAHVNIELEDFDDYLKNTWSHGKQNFYGALNRVSSYDYVYLIPIKYLHDNIECIILFHNISSGDFNRMLDTFIDYFTSQAFEILNIIINVYIKQIAKGIDAIKQSEPGTAVSSQKADEIIKAINNGDSASALSVLKEATLKNNEFDYVRNLTDSIISAVTNTWGPKSLQFFGINIDEIKSFISKESYISFLTTLINVASKYGFENSKIAYDTLAVAKEYINEHYFENVTLTDVAKHVAFSPSHFSRYFKKETGENFINYLNKVRVEKAKELLINTRYKVHEICKMVGYIAPMYFYKVFKQYTGYTAQEYRNKFTKIN